MIWLTIFFVVPLGYLAYQSLQSGNIDFGYAFTWAWGNYWTAIRDYRPQFIRSIEYAGISTVIALVVSYPVAYWIAFRGGRWKNLLLLFIIAPFFVTYLIRTLAWPTTGSSCTRCRTCTSSAAAVGSSRPGRQWSPASPTTSCPSWPCRSTSRSSRSTHGSLRQPRISTPTRSAPSCGSLSRSRFPA